MSRFKVHPLAKAYKLLSEEKYEQLRDDISQNGLIHPIILYEGKILDGRHRYKACEELGIQIEFDTYAGDDPSGYVRSMQNRRNVTVTEDACSVALLMQKAGIDLKDKEAAETYHINCEMLRKARKILSKSLPEF